MKRTTLGAALTACVALAGLLPSGAAAQPATAEPTTIESGLQLRVPKEVVAETYGKRVWMNLGVRLLTGAHKFELWSTRASYDGPIATEWRNGTDAVTLPEGTMKDFRGLPGFLRVEIKNSAGKTVLDRLSAGCLNGEGERIRPDGEPTSGYPWGCPYNPFTLGSVMGIPAGWAMQVPVLQRPQRLEPGRYTVTVSVTRKYRELFAIADEHASGTAKVRVKAHEPHHEEHHHRVAARAAGEPEPSSAPSSEVSAEPAAEEPTGPSTAAPTGPVPNLRSLPAFNIQVGRRGNYLQFAATVWNAGDSPLVVDGFRRDDEDVMDAYQYFYDGDGNQTGYTLVGEMEWDARDSHDHWHFRDFARYRLLDADLGAVSRSRKEAFCLANTDGVDYTIPNAVWRPWGTDLSTACGDYSSLAVREVLDVGNGDTYHQYRAGQSFALKGLPNGIYYIAVEANPHHRLVESSVEDNIALRKVRIGGKEGARTVKVFPVGMIDVP